VPAEELTTAGLSSPIKPERVTGCFEFFSEYLLMDAVSGIGISRVQPRGHFLRRKKRKKKKKRKRKKGKGNKRIDFCACPLAGFRFIK